MRRIPGFVIIVIIVFFSCKKDKSATPIPIPISNKDSVAIVDCRDSLTGYYSGRTSYTHHQVFKVFRYGDIEDSNSVDYSEVNDTIQIKKVGNDSIQIVSQIYGVAFLDTMILTDTFYIYSPRFTLLFGSAYGYASIGVDSNDKSIFNIHFYYTNGMMASFPWGVGYSKDYVSVIRRYKL